MNQELKKILEKVDGILISSPANIIYLTNYSGFSETERECILLITNNSNYLITDKRYSEAIKNQTKNFVTKDEGIYKFLKNDSKDLFKKLNIKTIGFEENNLTVSEFNSFKKVANLKPTDLTKLRIIKTNEETENIKLACKITDQTFSYILKEIKLGITEKEISSLIENFIREKNGETSFKSIVAFGKNSAIPHHQTSNVKLTNNQIILLDFGVKINNYCSDMTRTIYFGKVPEKFKKMHDVVLAAQNKAIEYINSKLSMVNGQLFAKDIDKVARDYIIKQKYPNIIHSVGHGIGVEVHEAPFISPSSKDIIKDNMIFSIEPGIYFSDYGGVRIEDLVLVKNGLAELISQSNREIIELPC